MSSFTLVQTETKSLIGLDRSLMDILLCRKLERESIQQCTRRILK